jgi:hypothetical protein
MKLKPHNQSSRLENFPANYRLTLSLVQASEIRMKTYSERTPWKTFLLISIFYKVEARALTL